MSSKNFGFIKRISSETTIVVASPPLYISSKLMRFLTSLGYRGGGIDAIVSRVTLLNFSSTDFWPRQGAISAISLTFSYSQIFNGNYFLTLRKIEKTTDSARCCTLSSFSDLTPAKKCQTKRGEIKSCSRKTFWSGKNRTGKGRKTLREKMLCRQKKLKVPKLLRYASNM